jgi:hypothetical protein
VLTALAPVSVSWKSRAGPITVTRDGIDKARVTLFDSNVLGIVSSGSTRVKACVSPPAKRDSLQVLLPTKTRPAQVDVLETTVTCSTGLRIDVVQGQSPAGRDALLLEGVRSLDLWLTATTQTLTGLKTGTVLVGGSHDLDRTDVVVEGEEPIRTHITSQRLHRVSLEVPPVRATSVRQAGVELVQTNFRRHESWVKAAFFGLIGPALAIGVAIHRFAIQERMGGNTDED